MIGEVISIGDELASGQRLDTNSQWISQQLGDLGVAVRYHSTVADDLSANVLVFQQAVARADVVVATGGLGPTADDLTRESLAQTLGAPLELHEPSLTHIQELFRRFRRPMPESNQLQAMFPRGTQPIFNSRGTAPGIDAVAQRPDGKPCRIFALPGVPAEMKEMFAEHVAPAVAAMTDQPAVIRHRRVKCFGVGESHLEQMLPDMIRRGRQPSVGITVHEATITLRVTARGGAVAECESLMQPTLIEIRRCLSDLAFGEEDDELEDAVVRLLWRRGASVATAEAATRGLVAQWLATADEARGAFNGGIALSESKAQYTTAESVERLAVEVRRQFQADFGLAIGGFPRELASDETGAKAAPTSAAASSADSSVPNATPQYYLALASPANAISIAMTLGGHPSIWLPRAGKQALNMLRLRLLHEPHPEGA